MVEFSQQIRDEERIAIVPMVEHILRAVAGLAERVVVLHPGPVLPTREALANPRTIEVNLGRGRRQPMLEVRQQESATGLPILAERREQLGGSLSGGQQSDEIREADPGI